MPRAHSRAESSAVRPERTSAGVGQGELEKLSRPGLCAALLQLAESAAFLHTAEGRAFARQLEVFLVPSMLASARKVGIGPGWLQADDVLHTVILGLCEQQGRVARRIAATARDPWGYLARCATEWVRALWGSRGEPLELLSPARAVLQPPAQPSPLTPLEEVVGLVFSTLRPHTEGRLHPPLRSLLRWFAQNPPQRRSHESDDREAAARCFVDFNRAQIALIANLVWGVRPRCRETSLFAALLMDADFRPSDSPVHARAILRYRQMMRAHSLENPVPLKMLAA